MGPGMLTEPTAPPLQELCHQRSLYCHLSHLCHPPRLSRALRSGPRHPWRKTTSPYVNPPPSSDEPGLTAYMHDVLPWCRSAHAGHSWHPHLAVAARPTCFFLRGNQEYMSVWDGSDASLVLVFVFTMCSSFSLPPLSFLSLSTPLHAMVYRWGCQQ